MLSQCVALHFPWSEFLEDPLLFHPISQFYYDLIWNAFYTVGLNEFSADSWHAAFYGQKRRCKTAAQSARLVGAAGWKEKPAGFAFWIPTGFSVCLDLQRTYAAWPSKSYEDSFDSSTWQHCHFLTTEICRNSNNGHTLHFHKTAFAPWHLFLFFYSCSNRFLSGWVSTSSCSARKCITCF